MVAERGTEVPKVQVFVKPLTGKSITIETKNTECIMDIKEKIKEKTHMGTELQMLMYQGTMLRDELTVEEHGIEKEVTLRMTWKLPGGAANQRRPRCCCPSTRWSATDNGRRSTVMRCSANRIASRTPAVAFGRRSCPTPRRRWATNHSGFENDGTIDWKSKTATCTSPIGAAP